MVRIRKRTTNPRHPLNASEPISQEALIAGIHDAFRDRRLRGRSWEQCERLDQYEDISPDDPSVKAERDWRQRIDDAKWEPFPGIGGFAFIDELGFLYYLPPTMIRFIRGQVTHGSDTHLPSTIARFCRIEFHVHVDSRFDHWSNVQLRCIARFIAFMANDRSPNGDDSSRAAWRAMLDAGWHRYLANHTER